MSIVEALRGISLDISAKPTISAKARALQSYAAVLGHEVLGIVAMAPFAIKSYWLYQRLGSGKTKMRVSLSKDQRYGPAPRNVLDVYRRREQGAHRGRPERRLSGAVQGVPLERAEAAIGERETAPVVLFIHGGVWASGAKWHYAKMASRLAEEGITTCVAEYTLYPHCTSERMAEEVGQALDWVVKHCVVAETQKVVLVGHSAGAHLCAMMLLDRAKASEQGTAYIPSRFVGMAGVYDIARHYQYEKARNVHHLSTMERAVGGSESFSSQSPAVLLRGQSGRGLPPVDVRRLPSIHLMASRSDIVVPHLESKDLHALLQSRGCPAVTLSLYDDVGHGDFVVEWQSRKMDVTLDAKRNGKGNGKGNEKENASRSGDAIESAASCGHPSSIEYHTSDLPPYAQELIRTILDTDASSSVI